MSRLALSLCCTMLIAALAVGQEPKPELLPSPRIVEPILPAPHRVVEMGPLGPVLPGYFLPDPYARWNLYALDKQGFPKPRVILAPQPYYLYNGQPYYFLRVQPQDLKTNPGP